MVAVVARRPQRIVRDGRELLTRAELARVSGERAHTIYKWWADRARTGHPDVVLVEIDGRPQRYFDLQRWRDWRAEHGAELRRIDGRMHATAAALARETGQPLANINHWYLHRATNGHPAAVILDRRRYVDLQQWRAWYAHHLAGRRAGLTPVDRRGDPDELITAAEASRILGHTHPGTLTSYVAHGRFIEADTIEELPSGRLRRRWQRRRVWEFADARSWSRQPTSR